MLVENRREQKILCNTKDNLYNERISHTLSSMSPIYESLDVLYKDLEILNDRCKICNRLIETHYYEPIKSELIKKNYCFLCNLWDERIKELSKPNVYVIDHNFYTDGGYVDKKGNGWGLGYGGRLFNIKSHKDGKIISTNNLWNGGDIPKHFWDKIPDNAEFVLA